MRAITIIAIAVASALAVAASTATATGPLSYSGNHSIYDEDVDKGWAFDGPFVIVCSYYDGYCYKFDTSTQPWTTIGSLVVDSETYVWSLAAYDGHLYIPTSNADDSEIIALMKVRISDLTVVERYNTLTYWYDEGSYYNSIAISPDGIVDITAYCYVDSDADCLNRFDVTGANIKQLPMPAGPSSTQTEYGYLMVNPYENYGCYIGASDSTASYFTCEYGDSFIGLLVIQHALDASGGLVYAMYQTSFYENNAYDVILTADFAFIANDNTFDGEGNRFLTIEKFDKKSLTFTSYQFPQFYYTAGTGSLDARVPGSEILYFITDDTPQQIVRLDVNLNVVAAQDFQSPQILYDIYSIAFNPYNARAYVAGYLESDSDFAYAVEMTQPDANANGPAAAQADTNSPAASSLTQSQVAGIGVGVAGFVVIAVVAVVVLVRHFGGDSGAPDAQPQAAAASAPATQA